MKRVLILLVGGMLAWPAQGAVLHGRGSSEASACRAAKTNGNLAFHEVKPLGPCTCRKSSAAVDRAAAWSCSVRVEYVKTPAGQRDRGDKRPGKVMDLR